MSISCSQFARRAAVVLPMLVMQTIALVAPATAQQRKTAPLPSLSPIYSGYFDGGLLNVGVNTLYAVNVLPDNQPQVSTPSGYVTFYVQNTGTVSASFNFTVNCSCTLDRYSATISPGSANGVQVKVYYGSYRGNIVLTASGPATDTGSIILSSPTYTVSVGPDGYPDYWYEQGQAGTANFTVSNVGNSSATYSLSGSCDAVAIGCSAPPPSVTVGPGGSASVPITFTAGAAGSSGYVYLNASGPSSDGGKVHVLVYSHTVSVAAPAAVSVDPGTYTASFSVTNTGNVQTTYDLSSTCGGQITGCSASLGQITVAAGATSPPVSVPYTAVNRGDAGTVTLKASYVGNSAVYGSGTMTVSVKHLYGVAVTPHNESQIVSPGGSLTFRVVNTGTDPQTSFSITANCQPTCTVSPLTLNNVQPGQTAGQNVTVSLGTYFGTVTLTATDQAHGTSDTGSIIPSAPTYTVSVSPDGIPDNWYEAGQAGTANFTVSNSGNTAATYSTNGSCEAVVTGCSSFPTSVGPVSPNGGSVTVSITFTAGAAGSSGYVRLNATSPSSDSGKVHVIVYSHTVSVAKGGTDTVYSALGLSRPIGVTNTGNVPNSYDLTLTCSGAISACGANPSISNLGVGLTQQVTITYNAANAGGVGTMKLVARNTVNAAIADSGTVTVTVKPKYTVAVTPDGGTAQADAWTTASVPFTVTNNGTASGSYFFTLICGGSAVRGNCLPDSTIMVIAAGQAAVVNVRFPAGAPLETANISLTAISSNDGSFSDAGSTAFTVTKYAVSVTPDAQAVVPAAYASYSQSFVVKNTGTTQRTFNLQATCALPAVTVCSSSTNSVTVASMDSAAVNVNYTAGDPASTGTLRLDAADSGGKSTDGGTLAVSVGTSVATNQVQFKNINPGTTIERSHCLIFSIVRDVADECGALRIVHPLPAVRTLGKARVPTLMYSSDQVQGPNLAVNIILADTTTLPQSVQLTVVRTWPDAHIDTLTRVYPGTDWQVNRSRRVSLPNVASGSIGILRYKVSVSLVYAGTTKLAAPSDTSELAFVDRTNSGFGAGWWLAGLEQLFPGQYDGSVLWVGGDGSTRKYVNQHTTVVGAPSDTVYLAAAFDRPDTLLHRSDGKYRREAGNGLYVEFDGLGLHKRTVNRLGYETDFIYDASNHLSTIQIPPWQGTTPAFTYNFSFNRTTQLLDAVTAPPLNNTSTRTALLTHSGTVIQTITEQLDSTYRVVFQLGTGLKYASRSDRLGVQTSFTYEASSPTIASFATATGTGTDTVRHTFRTATAIGAAGGSAKLDTVYFRYDGPRPAAVGDTTLFWLNRFGGPTRIIDAMGHETTIARGDARFPGLATEMRGPAPNKFTTWASYDDRGNLRASTQVNPHGDGMDATTMYLWHPKWDMDTLIVQPEGEVTHMGYDPNGNRVYQEDGRGTMSRVNFQYYATTNLATGAMAGLLSTVTLPSTATLASAASTITYDNLGNVKTTVSPRSTTAVTTNDALGRTIGTRNQINDAGDTTSTSVTYDLLDRVLRSVSYGPPVSGSAAHTVTVDNTYDREDRVLSVTRTQSPDVSRTYLSDSYPALGSLVSRYNYDNLGRKVAEIAPDSTPTVSTDNPVEYTFYDLAGNVDSVRTRRKDHVPEADTTFHVIKLTYDVLNRLKTRTVPAARYRARVDGFALADLSVQDTATRGYNTPYPRFFNNSYTATNPQLNYPNWGGYTVSGDIATYDYDETGNMTIADDKDARVRRQYYPNGQLRRDSLYTKTLQRDTVHMYGLEYVYDRDGRTTTLNHPTQLSEGATGYQNTMQYDPVTGALSKVVDPLGNSFAYGYDARSQVISLTMPNGVSEQYDYDQEGDMLSQWAGAPAGNTPFPGTVHDVKMTYDRRGKMLTLWNAVASKDTIAMAYSGLGYLVYNDHTSWKKGDPLTSYHTTEHFSFDPLGNRQASDFSFVQVSHAGGGNTSSSMGGDVANWYYRAGTGRLVFDDHSSTGTSSQNQTKYDEAGNIVFSTQKPNTSPVPWYEDRASYYSADGRLAAVDYRHISSDNSQGFHTIFDEYRYDALGRRILVRSQRRCGTEPNDCAESYVRRTVWAGAQELYEIQMPDNATARENDTGAVSVKPVGASGYDPNPIYGRVAFTFGLKLDEPLSVTRLRFMNSYSETWAPFSIVPLWTVRGTADTSYFAATGKTNCNGNGRCVLVSYGSPYWTPSWSQFFAPATFHGTLLTDKSDNTGQLFRRNRYYDPQSGRFTQEDPIGLAGGVNVYGFANGDPINFSDPFGLCPNCEDVLGAAVLAAPVLGPGDVVAAGLVVGAGLGYIAYQVSKSDAWDNAKKKVGRAIKVGLFGVITWAAGPRAAGALAQPERARIEAEQRKQKTKEDQTGNRKAKKKGTGSPGGPDDPPENPPLQ